MVISGAKNGFRPVFYVFFMYLHALYHAKPQNVWYFLDFGNIKQKSGQKSVVVAEILSFSAIFDQISPLVSF